MSLWFENKHTFLALNSDQMVRWQKEKGEKNQRYFIIRQTGMGCPSSRGCHLFCETLLPAASPTCVSDTNGKRAARNDCGLEALPWQTMRGTQATTHHSFKAEICYKGKIQTTLYWTADELSVSSEAVLHGGGKTPSAPVMSTVGLSLPLQHFEVQLKACPLT